MSDLLLHMMEQGSMAWHEERCGRASASGCDRIITNSGAASSAGEAYLAQCVAERVTGFNETELDDMVQTFWMARGSDLEDQARAAYALETDLPVSVIGGLQRGDFWLSPDGLVIDAELTDGPIDPKHILRGLEIQCPSPKNHVLNWMACELHGELPSWRGFKKKQQIHAALWLTGAPQWDFVSWCPGLPLVIFPVTPDDYTAKLGKHVTDFLAATDRVHRQMMEALQ